MFNTGIAYAVSVLGMGMSLFSSRWILGALGETDYGLFAVVGSIMVFVTLLNSILAGSVARHFAYAIGSGDPGDLNRWFNVALGMHLCFAAGFSLIGWPIGEYVITHVLTIPSDRLSPCLWVFRLSLISAFTGMASAPFIGMFTAQQRIAELSLWRLLQRVLFFTLAFILTRISWDRLVFNAAAIVFIVSLIQCVQILRALALFPACHICPPYWLDRKRGKELLSFAGWNLFGHLGSILRSQGSAILLNLHSGPSVNAAYGVANQVSNQTNQLSASMLGALSPEIIASEGRGDRSRMIHLSLRASKLGTILVMFLAIPLMAEMDYVLKIWLRNPPAYTATFCQLILWTCILDRISSGCMLAVQARGKIAAYQVTLGTLLILTLPIAWVLLKLGYPPTSVGVAFIITMIGCSLGRVFWANKLLGVSVGQWSRRVVLPCGIIAVATSLAALAPRGLLPSSHLRLALALFAGLAASALSTWFFGLDAGERDFFGRSMRRAWTKAVTWRHWKGQDAGQYSAHEEESLD